MHTMRLLALAGAGLLGSCEYQGNYMTIPKRAGLPAYHRLGAVQVTIDGKQYQGALVYAPGKDGHLDQYEIVQSGDPSEIIVSDRRPVLHNTPKGLPGLICPGGIRTRSGSAFPVVFALCSAQHGKARDALQDAAESAVVRYYNNEFVR